MRGERVKVGDSHTLPRERGGSEWEHGKERVEKKKIARRKRRASKKSLPRRGKRRYEQESGCNGSPGRSAESWIHS